MDDQPMPLNTKAGIDRYVDGGCPTGSFLYAVLTNNLTNAMRRADYYNRRALVTIAGYIYNFTPADCWGSEEKVSNWRRLHQESPEKAEVIAACDRERRKTYYENQS